MKERPLARDGSKDTTAGEGAYDTKFWTPTRIRRLIARLEFHRKRALSLNRRGDWIEVTQVIENYELFNNRCAYCQNSRRKIQMDHIVALARGGTHTLGNLAPSCRKCNRSKNATDLAKWWEKQAFYSKERYELILTIIKKDRPSRKRKKS